MLTCKKRVLDTPFSCQNDLICIPRYNPSHPNCVVAKQQFYKAHLGSGRFFYSGIKRSLVKQKGCGFKTQEAEDIDNFD